MRRNASAIQADWVTHPDNTVTTTRGCKLHVPVRYVDKGLLVFGDETYLFGYFGILIGEEYASCQIFAMLRIKPIGQTKVNVLGVEYYEFEFPPGTVVIENTNVVLDDGLLYPAFDYFVDSAYIPWFLSYDDILRMFHQTKYFTGIALGAHRAVLELIIANIARNPAKRTEYWRQCIFTPEDARRRPAFVPYKSVLYGPKGTTARLMGAYFDTALRSALVNPSERVDPIEALLRQ